MDKKVFKVYLHFYCSASSARYKEKFYVYSYNKKNALNKALKASECMKIDMWDLVDKVVEEIIVID